MIPYNPVQGGSWAQPQCASLREAETSNNYWSNRSHLRTSKNKQNDYTYHLLGLASSRMLLPPRWLIVD